VKRTINWIVYILLALVVSIPFVHAAEISLTYDANGNLVSGDGYYREYNSLNQLWKIRNGSNSSSPVLQEFAYDPIEERVLIKKTFNSTNITVETVYYIDKSFVQVRNTSGNFNFTYVHQDGSLVAQLNPDSTKMYFATDHKTNVMITMNQTGGVLEQNFYTGFGEIISGGNISRYDYEGKETSQFTGEIDFNFRHYNPDTARFTQPDTVIQNIYDPQMLNRYTFERNNPYKHTDPTGHVLPLAVAALIVVYTIGLMVLERDSLLARHEVALATGNEEELKRVKIDSVFFIASTFLPVFKGGWVRYVEGALMTKTVLEVTTTDTPRSSANLESDSKIIHQDSSTKITRSATDKNGKTALDRQIEKSKLENKRREKEQGLKFSHYDNTGKAVYKKI